MVNRRNQAVSLGTLSLKDAVLKILKIVGSLSLLAVLVWLVDPVALVEALSQITLANFTVLMLLSFIMIAISALKWQLFLQAFGESIPFLKLFRFYLAGYFINVIFPSYIGGDVLRSYQVGKAVGQHRAASATLLERYTGLLAMSLLGMGAALYEDRLLSVPIRLLVIGLGLAVFILSLVAIYAQFDAEKLPSKLIRKIGTHVSRLHEIMSQTSRNYGLWGKALLISFTYHVLTVANTYVAAQAVGWTNPPITELFVVLPIILIISAIPIAPSGLGIQEGAFMHFLQLLGATSPQALGVGIVLRAKTYILAFLGWIVWSADNAGREKLDQRRN